MYAAILLNGFTPDTMIVHPMAWLMWVKDPVLREFAIQSGGGSFFAQFTGNPAVLGNPFYDYGGLGFGQGQTGAYTNGQLTGGEVSQATAGNYQNMHAAPQLPNWLGIRSACRSAFWSAPSSTSTRRPAPPTCCCSIAATWAP